MKNRKKYEYMTIHGGNISDLASKYHAAGKAGFFLLHLTTYQSLLVAVFAKEI